MVGEIHANYPLLLTQRMQAIYDLGNKPSLLKTADSLGADELEI